MTNANRSSAPFLLAMVVWLALACVLGASGFVASLVPPQPQIMIVVLTLALLFSGWLHPGLRAWLAHVNLRGFIAFHITRFVGVVFLMMSARGTLSPAWALPAGWGDIAVATGALLLALFLRQPDTRPDLVRLWNLIGLIDIVGVVATAARIAMRDPAAMAPLLRFPMSLVLTFVVPIIIASHIWMALRLQPRKRAMKGTAAA